MKRIVCAAAVAANLVGTGIAAPEPWGEGFDGWRFTQDDSYGGIFCEGTRGNAQLVYSTNGVGIVRHTVAGIPPGTYKEAFLGWGPATDMDTSEMLDGSYFGGQLFFNVTKDVLEKIADAGYFEWGIDINGTVKRGKVTFTSGSLAFSNITDCVAANTPGGSTAAAPPPPQTQEDPFPEEPFGEDFDGWTFTQKASVMGGVICRARHGKVSLVRLTQAPLDSGSDGWLTIDGSGVNRGYRDGAVLDIGRASATVDSSSDGPDKQLVFFTNAATVEQAAINRGYSWSIGAKSGTVQFPDSATSALERAEECVTANR